VSSRSLAAALALAALAPLAHPASARGAAPARRDAAGPPPRGIILITVDSLRPDRLGCYTGGGRKTPNLDSLAARGVRYERAYAASSTTVGSAATILTGLLPPGHGLRSDPGGRLPDGMSTVATLLRAAGFRTAAVVGSTRLDSDRGLDAGFEKYEDSQPMLSGGSVTLNYGQRADAVTGKGLEWLGGVRKERFFLWLGFTDPHYDYNPPEPYKTDYKDDLYGGEIAFLDAQIGELFKGLRERGLEKTTAILLAGTHGEGLGEHGETGYGAYLHETTLRVPLILAAGGPPGVVKGPVGLADLAPTILDLAGARAPATLAGRPLLPRAGAETAKGVGGRLYAETLYPHQAYGWAPLFAVIEGDRKVVQGERLEAFDLATDPSETKPLAPPPAWAASLVSWGRERFGMPPAPSSEEKAAVLAGARALGLDWLDGPVCIDKTVWPDPRDRVELNDPLFRAQVAFEQGLVGRSAILGHEILEKDPANLAAFDYVIYLGLRNRWHDVALLPYLEILQCAYPYRGLAYHYLAHLYERRPDPDRTEKALQLFARLEPWSEEPFLDLALFYAGQGKVEPAFQNLRKAVALGADDFETIRKDPRARSIASDPRFEAIAGKPPGAGTTAPAGGPATPPAGGS
jgi:arylsulfatase A-like enzyme